MAQVHENIREFQSSRHIAPSGHKLGLQLRDALAHSRIRRQRRA